MKLAIGISVTTNIHVKKKKLAAEKKKKKVPRWLVKQIQ